MSELPAGVDAELVLDRTPFYAEAGGQVGDQGVVARCRRRQSRGCCGHVRASDGPECASRPHAWRRSSRATSSQAVVDSDKRMPTMRNHTATHLLHAALRDVLGTHVKQAGSVVEPSRLRFDFTHYAAVDREQLKEIERLMNEADSRERARCAPM